MFLSQLTRLVPPPLNPVDPGDVGSWLGIELELHIQLPQDYKDYINAFGSGQISGFISPLNPFSSELSLNLTSEGLARLDGLRSLKNEWGAQECPYPLYPEPGGLLTWGCTDNGDVLFWRTVGTPGTWSIVINESRGPLFEEYPGPMTSFLVQLLTGRIVSQIIPGSLLSHNPSFVSIG